VTRVRTDNVFGTLTDNPLTNVATTMNSAGLANLAVVSSAEALIVLDPNRVSGAPEHVVVTTHAGSATSATIVRGQFGTAARQHALGTEWVHAPIASNASSYATAADDQGDYVPMNAWESWTPTFTNLTVGNGTTTAKFVRIGRTVHFRLRFVFGSTSAMGTSPNFTLPVTASSEYVIEFPFGPALYIDAGTKAWEAFCQFNTATTGLVRHSDGAGAYTNTTATAPFTWTTSDYFMVSGSYEAAS
jgi:hypothetical protein